ncbi:M23 family metallopeptidase [Paraflavisolibacter sp. H34]|uniref:M23 family metallopeptidase n=1 Tax=Huijunlia imazamoxiresistens TaxID=3127457 RepID=UPI00301770E7
MDTGQVRFEHEVDEAATFVLRLQPELLAAGDYSLRISVGPSLGSPVAGGKGRVGSVWGDARDAGGRRHEGVDLFAPFRTPVVAAADGRITRVNENNLGGKVVWMKPKGRSVSLYYAHLDEQLATAGQKVRAGDTIGLVGNTGNARTTPPHLHFGIYGLDGAIDPLPFIDPRIKEPDKIAVVPVHLKDTLRLIRPERIPVADSMVLVPQNTLLYPLAFSSKTFRAVLPDGRTIQLPIRSGASARAVLQQRKLRAESFLYENPGRASARKRKLSRGTAVGVLGYFGAFAFVGAGDEKGWIPEEVLH